MNAESIIEIIRSAEITALKMLDAMQVLPEYYERVRDLMKDISRICACKVVPYFQNHIVVARVNFKLPFLILTQYKPEGKKYRVVDVMAGTMIRYLTSIGVPRRTMYRLIRKGLVRAVKISLPKIPLSIMKTSYFYVVLFGGLADALKPELASAIEKSMRSREAAARRKKAMERAKELGIPYDYRLADDEYYEKVKSNLIEEARRLKKAFDAIDNSILKAVAYTSILNRYAKLPMTYEERRLIYSIKDIVLCNAVRMGLHSSICIVERDWMPPLYEITFKLPIPDPYSTVILHIPKRTLDSCTTVKVDCVKYDDDITVYGRRPHIGERQVFPFTEILMIIGENVPETREIVVKLYNYPPSSIISTLTS